LVESIGVQAGFGMEVESGLRGENLMSKSLGGFDM